MCTGLKTDISVKLCRYVHVSSCLKMESDLLSKIPPVLTTGGINNRGGGENRKRGFLKLYSKHNCGVYSAGSKPHIFIATWIDLRRREPISGYQDIRFVTIEDENIVEHSEGIEGSLLIIDIAPSPVNWPSRRSAMRCTVGYWTIKIDVRKIGVLAP